MNTSKIIIVPKLSKYTLDMAKYKLTSDQLAEKYRREGIDIERILGSHARQEEALSALKSLFTAEQFISRDELTREVAARAELVIALGGDDHLKFVSHFVDATPIMAVNSDPVLSNGGLAYFVASGFETVLRRLENEQFDIEEWARLEAMLNGSSVGLATSEFFLGEDRRRDMSRHILEFDGAKEEQRCSGLLVVTGAGSSGWYDAAGRFLHSEGDKFSPKAKHARFLITEPFGGRVTEYSMVKGTLEIGQELVVHSLNDSRGVLTNDSIEEQEFNRGTKAVIRIADTPLGVVNMGAG